MCNSIRTRLLDNHYHNNCKSHAINQLDLAFKTCRILCIHYDDQAIIGFLGHGSNDGTIDDAIWCWDTDNNLSIVLLSTTSLRRIWQIRDIKLYAWYELLLLEIRRSVLYTCTSHTFYSQQYPRLKTCLASKRAAVRALLASVSKESPHSLNKLQSIFLL